MNEAQAVAFCADIAQPSIVICLEIPDKCAITRLTIRGNFDDGRSSIDKRLKIWNEKTRPLADEYKATVINSERPVNEILRDLENTIN